MSPWSHFKAALSISVITLNLLVWCVPLLVLGFFKWLMPGGKGRLDGCSDAIYRGAVRVDDAWLKGVMGLHWNAPAIDLAPDTNVIILSNHVSWADILLIQSVVVRDGPILKFLAKRELIYVPIFGTIFWAFDFPILRRQARTGQSREDQRQKDFEAIQDACGVLKRRPAALMNFAEGTRFREEKRDAQSSRYTHLLEPRVGGFSAMLDALESEPLVIVDFTLKYSRPHSLWRFLAGLSERIEIDGVVVDRSEVPLERSARAAWLSERWGIKDREIAAFQLRNESSPVPGAKPPSP